MAASIENLVKKSHYFNVSKRIVEQRQRFSIKLETAPYLSTVNINVRLGYVTGYIYCI